MVTRMRLMSDSRIHELSFHVVCLSKCKKNGKKIAHHLQHVQDQEIDIFDSEV
jgi:hypothetical protein